MLISNQKSRSVFDRCNSASDQELKMAAAKQTTYLDPLRGHNSGHS